MGASRHHRPAELGGKKLNSAKRRSNKVRLKCKVCNSAWPCIDSLQQLEKGDVK